jgi:2-oxoisovalerate ferredoxin oxidoreductase beta subunit
MPDAAPLAFTAVHQKPRSLYPRYTRKEELQNQTHYCPGCGHGIVHKLIARAIDELAIQDRTVLISPVGCSVFAYYYFDTGNIQVAHGRAPAVAAAVKRSRPESVVLAYQGDGDLAAIGTAEIVHAANRGEPITVVFINNGIYGMTGGQMAPTTLIGQTSTTTPLGRDPWNEGYPLHVSELLASLKAPVYIERAALGNNRQIMGAARAIRRAIENQVKGLGFSLVEVLSPCPTIWKLSPVDAQRRVLEEMSREFPLGVFRDRTATAAVRRAPEPPPPASAIPSILGVAPGTGNGHAGRAAAPADWRVRAAGFGGQGVLLLGELLAEAGLDAGLEVSWLPSYGPEMRSGTSNCHVRLSDRPIDSPLVSRPNVLLALNEPSLRKFLSAVEPGGWVFYNGLAPPDGCARADVRFIARPFAAIADGAGSERAANMAMLGALIEATGILTEERVLCVLRRKVPAEHWLEINRRALQGGREAAGAGGNHEN